MSRFIKRFGTQKIHYDFEIQFLSIEIPPSLTFSGTLKISLKKGKRIVETESIFRISHPTSIYPLNESLLFPATLYLNKKSSKYLEKPVIFFITLLNDSFKPLQTQLKFDFSEIPSCKEKTFQLSFEKNLGNIRILLNLSIKTLSTHELADSFISGISFNDRMDSSFADQRANKTYDFKIESPNPIDEASRKHPSLLDGNNPAFNTSGHSVFEILDVPAPKFNKTPSCTIGEVESKFLSRDSYKKIKPMESLKEEPEKRNIKGIKVQIFHSDINQLLKKNKPQEEDLKYKEKEELLDKILSLEKTIQRKNDLFEENLKKIKELHSKEEELKLSFYKQSKENSNRIKTFLTEIEGLGAKNLQLSENAVESRRELQMTKELLIHKEKEINVLKQELFEKNEENSTLLDLNRKLLQGTQDQKEFFKDFHAFNSKIKSLYEENQALRDKNEGQDNEMQALIAQKDFLYNLYEKSKEDLDIKEKKQKENEEIINFYINSNKKTDEIMTELKRELKQRVFEREEALSKQTAIMVELQNLKFKYMRIKTEIPHSDEIELSNLQEENAYLRKENQLLQKKLELLLLTLTEEKEDNASILRASSSETEKLKKDLALSENRRLELETELIHISRSSKTFLISEQFDTLKRTYEGKVKFFNDKSDNFDEKIKELSQENQHLRLELAEKTLDLKRQQMESDEKDSFIFPQQEEKTPINNEIIKEKDEIILNCHEKMKDLIAEISFLKSRIETVLCEKDDNQGELENEIGKLSVENEKLLKKIKESQREKEKLNEELMRYKESSEKDLVTLAENEEKLSVIDRERREKEEKIGILLMKAIEIGGNELVDKLTGVL